MEEKIIREIANKRKISSDAIIKEYYEYLILGDIWESEIGNYVVFKGGTALRIFYDLPRYSDDIDFSIIKDFGFEKFSKTMKLIEKKYYNVFISALWNKKNTFICEYKIKESWLKQRFSVKVEISRRETVKLKDVELKMAVFKEFNLQLLGNVLKLEKILEEKIKAFNSRKEPKDYFDIWYISNILKKPFKIKKDIDKKVFKQTLKKYLPLNYQKILDNIL